MYINGEWLSTEKEFDVFNPANGELIAKVADGGAEHAARAIDAASQAFTTWSKTTAYARAEVLLKAYQLMVDRKPQLAELMTQEQGKPLKAALNEVQYAAGLSTLVC